MSNHPSLYDIPVLFAVMGPSLRMIAKKELFPVPIFERAIHPAHRVRATPGARAVAMAREPIDSNPFAGSSARRAPMVRERVGSGREP